MAFGSQEKVAAIEALDSNGGLKQNSNTQSVVTPPSRVPVSQLAKLGGIQGTKARDSLSSMASTGIQNSPKIFASRHTLTRRSSSSRKEDSLPSSQRLIKRPKSANIMIVKTQRDSLRRSYGSLNSLARSSSSFQSLRSTNSNVSFQNVSVREYPRCVGDNPSVSSGPPLTIGWEPVKTEELSIEDYEKRRMGNHCTRIPARARHQILECEWDVPTSRLLKASIDVRVVRQQRLETMNQTKYSQKIEEALESTRRTIKKLSFNKNKNPEKNFDMYGNEEPCRKRKHSNLFRSNSSRDGLCDLDKAKKGDTLL